MDKKFHTAERNIKFPEIEHSKKEFAVNEEDVNAAYTFDERRVKKLSSGKRLRMSSRSEPVKKHSKENLSINIESNISMEHSILFDEDEQTPTATPMESENESFTFLDADSRERSTFIAFYQMWFYVMVFSTVCNSHSFGFFIADYCHW